jgi:hypothetical protein
MMVKIVVIDPKTKTFDPRGRVMDLACVPQVGNKISYKPFDSEHGAYVYDVIEVMFQDVFHPNPDDPSEEYPNVIVYVEEIGTIAEYGSRLVLSLLYKRSL